MVPRLFAAVLSLVGGGLLYWRVSNAPLRVDIPTLAFWILTVFVCAMIMWYWERGLGKRALLAAICALVGAAGMAVVTNFVVRKSGLLESADVFLRAVVLLWVFHLLSIVVILCISEASAWAWRRVQVFYQRFWKAPLS